MNIFIVAATEQELSISRDWCKHNFKQKSINTFIFRAYQIQFVVHGVGIMASTFAIQKIALQMPDLIIQIGIAGSFNKNVRLGETVIVQKDSLGDFGAEDDTKFISIFDLGLVNENLEPFKEKWLVNTTKLPKYFLKHKLCNSTTVQKVSGNKNTIQQIIKIYNPDIETMEGASLHYVCTMYKLNYLQLRSISNQVEVRDKSKWRIQESIQKLNEDLIKYFGTL